MSTPNKKTLPILLALTLLISAALACASSGTTETAPTDPSQPTFLASGLATEALPGDPTPPPPPTSTLPPDAPPAPPTPPTGAPGEPTFPPPTESSAPYPLDPGDSVVIHTIKMITTSTGWALGGVGDQPNLVLRTTDGGYTWKIVRHFPLNTNEAQTRGQIGFVGEFLDAQRAWVAIDSPDYAPGTVWIWRTTNGGQTWSVSDSLFLGKYYDYYYPTIRFADAQNGWFLAEFLGVGAGSHWDHSLFRTTDGGATWSEVPFSRYNTTGMAFANADTGWITEERTGPYAEPILPIVLVTGDGGRNWQTLELPEPPDNPGLFSRYRFCASYSPTLFSPSSGALVVECFDTAYSEEKEKYIYTTSNGGQTWQSYPYPGGELQFSSPGVGWALGRDIYKTQDGGQTWTQVKTVFWDGQFSFVNDQTAWAVARTDEEIALVYTTDGGLTWDLITPTIAP